MVKMVNVLFKIPNAPGEICSYIKTNDNVDKKWTCQNFSGVGRRYGMWNNHRVDWEGDEI